MSPTRMAPETVVAVKVGERVMLLSWSEFSDLANCCHEIAEHGQAVMMTFGCVGIEIRKP